MLPSSIRLAGNPDMYQPRNGRLPVKTLPRTPAPFAGSKPSGTTPTYARGPLPPPINVRPATSIPTSSLAFLNSRSGLSSDPEKGFLSSLLTPPLANLRSHFSVTSGIANGSSVSLVSSTGKISKSADPDFWVFLPNTPGSATDDWLHNPDPRRDRYIDRGGSICTSRGFVNIGCIFVFFAGMIALFAGYPLISHYQTPIFPTVGGLNLGGVNGSGQRPMITGNFGLIDKDTPASAYTKPSFEQDGTEFQLVFSDEFSVDGRTFYPGDDPFWEAEDLHYWETNNLEWYDPVAVTTKGGNLMITLSRQPSHGLNFQGGLVSSWNKFCFTGGLLEVNVVLPGASDIQGLWPAIWAMGNLGRMGYGASLEGMWPYSYNSCDVGTLKNQTFPDGTPEENNSGNDPTAGGALSFLPGQKLSACTCAGEDHPGPQNADGSFVGRGVPEIDVFEATINADANRQLIGQVSQSAQWAPFNEHYKVNSTGGAIVIEEPNITKLNSFIGGAFQQTISALVNTNNSCGYEASGSAACFQVYGFEYEPGNDGYITWISSNKASWTIKPGAVGPDPVSGASQRLVSQEPMYIIMNLGLSLNFGPIDFADLVFPATMYVDYVRVYQPKDQINIGCDPASHPTSKYIQNHIGAYTNANLTTWAQYGQTFPKNNLVDTCSS